MWLKIIKNKKEILQRERERSGDLKIVVTYTVMWDHLRPGEKHKKWLKKHCLNLQDCELHLSLPANVECYIIQGTLGRIFRPSLE